MPSITREKNGFGNLPEATSFLLLSVIYFCLTLLLANFSTVLGWTIFWPLNGLSIALLLRSDRKKWLPLLAGAQTGVMAAQLLQGETLQAELLKRVWSTSEVLLSALILPTCRSMDGWLTQPRFLQRLSGALIVPPSLTALLFGVQVSLAHRDTFFRGWNQWGPPDMLGNAIMLPVALAITSPEMSRLFSPSCRTKTVSVLCAVAAVCTLAFSESSYPMLFLLYPCLLFVDSKLSLAGSSVALLLASVIGLACTTHGIGPFGRWPAGLSISAGTALQVFLGFHTLALLPLSLVIMERRRVTVQLTQANEKLLFLSQQDPLTGVANRRSFDQVLATAWSRQEEEEYNLSILMIDIDHFKKYNDLYGHVKGDKCLTEVAGLLNGIATATNSFLARIGGEEFAVLLENRTSRETQRIAERFRSSVVAACLPHRGNASGQVTISIGIATTSDVTCTKALELINAADCALYAAKGNGRNRAVVWAGNADPTAPLPGIFSGDLLLA